MMRTDTIEAVGIDERESLWVKPSTATFPYIYREAMEVHWDAERYCLYSPKPREWSYTAWFRQIICAAHYQGINLKLEQTTLWLGIAPELQRSIKDNDSRFSPCVEI